MNLPQAVLATLAYHDIFDYPLKPEEIHDLLIEKHLSHKHLRQELESLRNQKKIGEKSGYFFLKFRSQVVAIRRSRERYSKGKIKKARFFASILKIIPTVKMVAVSGALAMNNCHKNDDIDLVIVASKNTLWTTRFFANIVLLPFKRDPQGQKVTDHACLNLFLDESALKIKDQNLYTAHEICQMKLLWHRDNIYQNFLKANAWITKYLPNWHENVEGLRTKDKIKTQKNSEALVFSRLALVAENFLKSFQLWYMKGKKTTEKIGEKQLFFHPKRTQGQVLASFHKKIKALRIRTT